MIRTKLVHACAAIASVLTGCASAQQAPAFPAGGTFAWTGTDAGGASRSAPADPARYTIRFDAGGRAILRLDCNRGSARWTRDAGTLSISPPASTKMLCPDGSLDATFAADLAQVTRWRVESGDLVLDTRDGSVMRFRPLPR